MEYGTPLFLGFPCGCLTAWGLFPVPPSIKRACGASGAHDTTAVFLRKLRCPQWLGQELKMYLEGKQTSIPCTRQLKGPPFLGSLVRETGFPLGTFALCTHCVALQLKLPGHPWVKVRRKNSYTVLLSPPRGARACPSEAIRKTLRSRIIKWSQVKASDTFPGSSAQREQHYVGWSLTSPRRWRGKGHGCPPERRGE